MTPRLILLNGPPGVGKSTIARRYVDGHPLALNLDVDVVRSLLGQWTEHEEAGHLARALSLAMARTHLTDGRDVVVPQLLARLVPFLESLEALADDVGATFHELVLMDKQPSVQRRFAARQRPDVAADAVETYYDAVATLIANRPRAVTIAAPFGEVDETYAAVLRCLSA